MIDFHSFETFDPNGPGLGNLFGQISPFEALGIWPSGDFRLTPGAGAVPALGYYLGAAFASILLLYGALLCWRRRETAILAGLAAAALAYAAARSAARPTRPPRRSRSAPAGRSRHRPAACCAARSPGSTCSRRGGCSLLALANAPVGPASYTPALTGCAPTSAKARPWCSPRVNCSPTNTAPPISPGSCAAVASASRPGGSRRPAAFRRSLRRDRIAPARPPFPGFRVAASLPIRPLGARPAGPRHKPLSPDRRPPSPPGLPR